MDFYAVAWLSGFGFLGICLLCVAWSIDHLADAISDRSDREDW